MARMTRTISVRLDEEALQALDALEADGASRSEAIRGALVGAADRGAALQAEATAIAADPGDREELRAVQELMDGLSEPW